MRILLIALCLGTLCGQVSYSGAGDRILLLGDSMMASNRGSGQSVAAVIEAAVGQDVSDRSVAGARYFYNLPITGKLGLRLTEQYQKGQWNWVVLNGGGNDLLFGCGCSKCAKMLDRLVSKDGLRGAIPSFIANIRKTGAKVIYVGYLRNPGVQSPIKACKPAGDELDRRLTRMARGDAGITFLPMSDLVPSGDRTFHQSDLIHPSVKGSRGIGARIAHVIKK
ncbi:MAG: SGNH/GDSL hydrolase family protein [Rhodoferax sp.]|nr:SGNH/GDSL hydrolase family protein [Pseudorhodobacter sp.]